MVERYAVLNLAHSPGARVGARPGEAGRRAGRGAAAAEAGHGGGGGVQRAGRVRRRRAAWPRAAEWVCAHPRAGVERRGGGAVGRFRLTVACPRVRHHENRTILLRHDQTFCDEGILVRVLNPYG
jgi:hypothetical protein